MIDCSRYVMYTAPYRECVIAVTETRNVTGRLGRAEVRALRVLADAGLVPPLARVLARPGSPEPVASFPTRKRRDGSGPAPFLLVNRGIVME